MEALGVSATLVGKIRQMCVEEGMDATLDDRPRPGAAPKLRRRASLRRGAAHCLSAVLSRRHVPLAYPALQLFHFLDRQGHTLPGHRHRSRWGPIAPNSARAVRWSLRWAGEWITPGHFCTATSQAAFTLEQSRALVSRSW